LHGLSDRAVYFDGWVTGEESKRQVVKRVACCVFRITWKFTVG